MGERRFLEKPHGRDVLVVERRAFGGKEQVHLRIFFHADDGTLKPSAKGVALYPDELDDVIAALGAAREEASR